MDVPFLRTKYCVPPQRAAWVPRPRLIARLDAGLERKLILVSAPAGFGKTTLLCEWIRHVRSLESPQARADFAWLSLDEGDNDASRFLSYLARALQPIHPSIAETELADLRAVQPPAIPGFLNRLINALDERQQAAPDGSRLVLVLDDYHLITAEPVHRCLVYLLDHLPARMHLVVAARADPPLSLARLRARGQVLELRAAELRFSREETCEFLNRIMGLSLSEGDIAALETRTEGWIAGLQMAALALQEENRALEGESLAPPSGDRLSAFVAGLTGSNRYIMDYLVEEVLQRQPEEVQDFLLKTSILERMCAPLCAAVLQAGGPESSNATPGAESPQPNGLTACQRILDHLDRANLFVVPLDDQREWYRYHRLFADLLRKRAELAFPGRMADLRRQASEWFERHDALEEAIEHALAAQDGKRAAGLVEKAAEGMMVRSEFITLRRWLDQLPEEQIAGRPSLCVFHAWTLFLSNSPLRRVEERLELIQACDESQAFKAAPLRAYMAAFGGLISQASSHALRALSGLPEEETFLRSMAYIVLAASELSEGDPEAGYRAFEQAARIGDQTGNLLASVLVLAGLAENDRKQGRLRQAEALYRQAIALAVDSKGKRLPIAGKALCGLGDLMREWNRLEAAERYLKEGIELLESWGALVIYTGYLALARLKQSQGDLGGAMEIVQKLRRLAAQTKMTLIDDWVVDMAQASLWVVQGELHLVEDWAERRGLLREPDPAHLSVSERFAYAHLRKYELIVLARLRIAQGQSTAALQLLDSLLPETIKASRLGLRIEIQVLRTLALSSLGRQAQALTALEAALSLAEPAGYVRIFLDEGRPMQRLLSEAHRRNPSSAYAAVLLAAFEGEGAPAASRKARPVSPAALLAEIEPLSERERQVLALLSTRMTVPEMARALCVAESTLRSHVKSIYGKLGVHRRVDAVQRAEELGLSWRAPS